MSQVGIIISCFDLTGNMVKPWLDAGYECHIVDTQHPEGKTVEGRLTKWGMDVKKWESEALPTIDSDRIRFASFFPPCTDLAVSGARWFASKEQKNPGTRRRAMELVLWSNRCGEKLGCPYFIENPVSVISSEWRKPDFVFHPYWYGGYEGGSGDAYTKTTCLWTGGNFTMPEEKRIPLDRRIADKIHRMPPSADRQNLRSQTPVGFAQAIYIKYGSPPPSGRRNEASGGVARAQRRKRRKH